MFRTKHQDTLEPTTRIFTPTRVVTLALIAVLVAACTCGSRQEKARSPCRKGRALAS
jgi:hypothetical protein